MNSTDKAIMLFMVLWIMKLQLQIWHHRRLMRSLEYELQYLRYNPDHSKLYPSVKELYNAEAEVSALHGKDDVSTAGVRGELHGSGPAVGDKTEDT